jgi:hypothetical protein
MRNHGRQNGDVQETALVRDKDGRLVFTGRLEEGVDWLRLVENMREERILEIWRYATGDMTATLPPEDQGQD